MSEIVLTSTEATREGREIVREKIHQLEVEMFRHPQVEIPPTHYFAKGLYAREIFIPKGTLLTGKIHRSEHLNIISKGDISVVTEFGIKRITAPHTMVSRPGTKRVGYAHEDTVWTTIHATEEKDLSLIEKELISVEYDAIDCSGLTKEIDTGEA